MATSKRKKRSGPKKIVVIGRRHAAPKRRKRSGSVGSTRHRGKSKSKRKSRIGATGSRGQTLKKIAWMAVGVGTGAALTHLVIRPIERKLVNKWPMVGKFIAAGEVFLGGLIALKGKKDFVRSVGVGILAGGVHGLLKQANIYKHLPSVSGPGDEYSTIRVPINGDLDNIISGLLQDRNQEVNTNQVAGMRRTDDTAWVAGGNYSTTIAGDEWETAWDAPMAKGL